ncbi:MAG: RNA polymerase sigma factor [Lachnospiraceae bacterium]|nr:RNA polymerase sigma factor [Lachnospiraceae bacterium]
MEYEIGPADSFEALVGRYETLLYRAALAVVGNVQDAEDAVQETFLKVYEEKNPDFASAAHEKAWLIKVTVNECKNRLRSGWFRKTAPLLETYPAGEPEQRELLEQVMALPASYRAVIHLYYYEGYSTAEIARILSKKEGTVRSLMSRAREKLRKVMEEGYGAL